MKLLKQHRQVGVAEFRCFAELPSAEFTYRSVRHCEEESQQDSSLMELTVAQASATLSNQHLWELFYMYKSWAIEEVISFPLFAQEDYTYLSLIVSGLVLSRATNHRFVSISAVIGALRGAIRRKLGGEEEAGGIDFSPFVYGPFDGSQWNRIESYQQRSGHNPASVRPFTEKLVEFLVTTPLESFKGMYLHVITGRS
jgi:hypothetical protein